jgi:hypothetical protein
LFAAIALAAVAAAPAHAGALAASNLNISQLFLSDASGNPLAANATIQIVSESRQGTAAANYNGVVASNGPSNLSSSDIGGSVDVLYQLAGPSAGSVGAALYGGVLENNTTTHISPPASANYALGDMQIGGSAIGGSIVGLTRADAAAISPDNAGGSSATILNSASLVSTFTVGASFVGNLTVYADSYFNVWVDTLAGGEKASASAGQGWTATIDCTDGASATCDAGWSTLTFTPAQLQITRTSNRPAQNFTQSFDGYLTSAARTFVAGADYTLTVNQSTNVTVRDVPEPMSLSLLGLALLAAGAATRSRKAK